MILGVGFILEVELLYSSDDQPLNPPAVATDLVPAAAQPHPVSFSSSEAP